MESNELTHEEKMEIIEDYMSDPYNQVNASLSAVVSMGNHAIGGIDMLELLASYIGMVMGSTLTQMDVKKGEILLDQFNERMKEILHAIVLDKDMPTDIQ